MKGEIHPAESEGGSKASEEARLSSLIQFIEEEYHAGLKRDLPRLRFLAEKVSRVHGGKDQRLTEVRKTLAALADELELHLEKEERILFPAIRELEESGTIGETCFASVRSPVDVMRRDHGQAEIALESLQRLTDQFTPPSWGCGSYRALLDGMRALSGNLREHMRLEEENLFPSALALESRRIA